MKDVADHPNEQNIIRFGLSQIIREFDSLSGAITEPERKSEILASVVPTSDVCLT